MNKRMNKRGQEMWQLLVLLLGIAVVVIVIIGAIFGFDKIFGLFRPVDTDLTIVAKQCEFSVESDLKIAYCTEFKEVKIAGVTQYVNCQYPNIATNLAKTIECPSDINTNSKNYCETRKVSLGEDYKDDVLVNGQSCRQRGVPKQTERPADEENK